MKKLEIILVFCGLIACCLSDDEIGISPRITGGQTATLGQFPYHVFIVKKELGYSYYCSGSLIKYNWVLTSASCVRNYNELTLHFGIVNRTQQATWNATVFDSTHVKIHPNYDSTNFYNDIALIYIESAQPSLINSTYIGVVNLPMNSSDFAGLSGTITGFGWLNQTALTGSNNLMFINVPIINNSECSNIMGAINETNLCVDTSGGKTTCNEDNGSGITVSVNGTTLIVGIATKIDCIANQPALFTRVSSYLTWINQQISQITSTSSTTSTTTQSLTSTQGSTTPGGSMKISINFLAFIFSLIVLINNF